VNIVLGIPATWQQTLTNVAKDNPDFLLDLGDTFEMDGVSSQAVADTNYIFQRRSTGLGLVSPSVPIFIVVGNHENQEGWHLNDNSNPANTEPVWGTNAQKKYFPNPVPNDFYTGNTDTYPAINGDHLHEDYYAWTWGDALFVTIDPFWYTTAKPFPPTAPSLGEPGPRTGNRWSWTLGQQQFNWLVQTLENSTAAYKFLFMHHPTGGTDDYIRGGAYAGTYVEWGGSSPTDTLRDSLSYYRPTWPNTIHQILEENNVSAVFHGHDHQYGYEKRDGVVYQALPAAGFSGPGFSQYSSGPYLRYVIKALNSPGHLRVTVSPSQATVDYVNSTNANGSNGSVAYSYTIPPSTPLPIQLASFTASVVRDNDVEVAWRTVSETNNYGFEVYRKRNENGDWEKVGFTKGHGTTLVPQSYSYIDKSVGFGKYLYQIKQIDLDGTSKTYPEVQVSVGVEPGKLLLAQNYPNPFNPSTLIEFVVPKSGFATIKVYNVLGQEVATVFNGNAEAGKINAARFNASSLPSGVYFYRIVAGSFVDTKKMLLLR
jgi:hypothetical protein